VPDDHEIVSAVKSRLLEAERCLLQNTSLDSNESFDSADVTRIDRTLEMDEKAQQQMEGGDYDAAIATLTSILAIRRRRLTKKQRKQKDAKQFKEKDAVARTLGNFATVLSMKGERKQAKMLFEEAIQLYKSNGMDSNDPVILDLVMELEQIRLSAESDES
jgi:tetratricopeptide (TPR) repeat protein